MIVMPAIREKRFHTRCQEEVYRQVKSYLGELVDEYFDDAEHCDFYLKYGSTVLEISIDPYEEDDAVIEVLAFCVQGVEPSFEMMRELLRLNSQVPLGAFSLDGKDIFFSHSFLGRRMSPEQFIASLDSVANISDEYDEKLVAQYGGETALECIRSRTLRRPEVAAKAEQN
ncbi:MAG TPA: YbjN domain-containing protein [Thermoanaerobaculia bacterium]